MRLLVCAATGKELAALAPHSLASLAATLEEAGLNVTSPVVPAPAGLFLPHVEAWLCLTGIGPINAALGMGLTLTAMRAAGALPQVVLNSGVAGAFDLSAVPLRTLCLVREEIWPEYGLHDGKSVTAQAFSWPLWQREEAAGGPVYDRLPLADVDCLETGKGSKGMPALQSCRSLTVAGVSASFDRARDIHTRYRAELENMEGFAVAYACARCGIPCLEVRTVSNKVGPRAKHEKDFPGALAALAEVLPALKLAKRER